MQDSGDGQVLPLSLSACVLGNLRLKESSMWGRRCEYEENRNPRKNESGGRPHRPVLSLWPAQRPPDSLYPGPPGRLVPELTP